MATIEQMRSEVCPPETDELGFQRIEDDIAYRSRNIAISVYIGENADPTSVKLVVPGYLGIQPSYESIGKELANLSQNSIVLRPLRQQEWMDAVHPSHLFTPLKLPSQVLRKIINYSQTEYGFNEFDLLAHSMGGPTAMNLADNDPRNLRSILLIGSAGLDGQNFIGLASKLPGALNEIVRAVPKLEMDRRRAARHVLHYVMANPLRTLTEALAVANSDIHSSIDRARQNGIAIGRLQFLADPFFKISNISSKDKNRVDYYQEFPDPEAGHLALLLQPKKAAKISSEMINHMLSNI